MIFTFLMVSTSSITCKVWGDRTTRAGCRVRKCGVCVFVCHAPSTAGRSLELDIFEQPLCRCLWVDFDSVFTVFKKLIAFSEVLDSLYFCL